MYAATASAYRDQTVSTASPGRLVTMLYDRVLTALTRCRTSTDAETVNGELQRAQEILSELNFTLDHDRGGDIARNLAALYDFCTDRLIRANISKDLALIEPVERVVSELRAAWAQAVEAAEQ